MKKLIIAAVVILCIIYGIVSHFHTKALRETVPTFTTTPKISETAHCPEGDCKG